MFSVYSPVFEPTSINVYFSNFNTKNWMEVMKYFLEVTNRMKKTFQVVSKDLVRHHNRVRIYLYTSQ